MNNHENNLQTTDVVEGNFTTFTTFNVVFWSLSVCTLQLY